MNTISERFHSRIVVGGLAGMGQQQPLDSLAAQRQLTVRSETHEPDPASQLESAIVCGEARAAAYKLTISDRESVLPPAQRPWQIPIVDR